MATKNIGKVIAGAVLVILALVYCIDFIHSKDIGEAIVLAVYVILALGICFGFVWAIIDIIKNNGLKKVIFTLVLWLTLFVFVFALVVHGLLFPQSASLYLVLKILFALLLVPLLCHKIYADYVTFRSSRSGSA